MIKAMKLDRRVWVATGLICLLLVVAVINQAVNQDQSAVGVQDQQDAASVFAAYRAERNLTRQRQVEYLDSIIQNQDTQPDTRDEAQQQKMALTSALETEANIETVLKTKGLADCVVVYNQERIDVMVNMPQLTTAQVAQVVEAVTANTSLGYDQIKIVPNA